MITKSKEEMQEIIQRNRRRKDVREQAEKEFNEIFWPQVVYKVGKRDALNAYVRMRTRGDVDCTAQELVDAYNAYANQVEVKKYTKHPWRWISGENWEDAPVERPLSIEERIQRLEQSSKVTTMQESSLHRIAAGLQWILRIGNPSPMVMLGEVGGQWTFEGSTIEECLQKAEAELL